METILGYLAQAFPIISSIAIVLIVPKVVNFLPRLTKARSCLLSPSV